MIWIFLQVAYQKDVKHPEKSTLHFKVADVDHIDRLSSYMYMALLFYKKGASSSKFVSYCNNHTIPVLDKVSLLNIESRRLLIYIIITVQYLGLDAALNSGYQAAKLSKASA